MAERLLFFLPPGTEVLFISGVAVALMLGLVSMRKASGLIVALLLMVAMAPFFDSLMATLPWWLSLLLTGLFLGATVRAGMCLLMGKWAGGRAFDRLLVWLVTLPFRLVARATWGLSRRVAGRATDTLLGEPRRGRSDRWDPGSLDHWDDRWDGGEEDRW